MAISVISTGLSSFTTARPIADANCGLRNAGPVAIWRKCGCGVSAGEEMAQAAESPVSLGRCDDKRPWLGPYANEKCGESNRLLIRTASNAYFTQLVSVISLPDRNQSLRESVETVWDFVGEAEDIEGIKYERKKAKVQKVLEEYTNYEVFQEIKVRRGQSMEKQKSIKQAEMETLIGAKAR